MNLCCSFLALNLFEKAPLFFQLANHHTSLAVSPTKSLSSNCQVTICSMPDMRKLRKGACAAASARATRGFQTGTHCFGVMP